MSWPETEAGRLAAVAVLYLLVEAAIIFGFAYSDLVMDPIWAVWLSIFLVIVSTMVFSAWAGTLILLPLVFVPLLFSLVPDTPLARGDIGPEYTMLELPATWLRVVLIFALPSWLFGWLVGRRRQVIE